MDAGEVAAVEEDTDGLVVDTPEGRTPEGTLTDETEEGLAEMEAEAAVDGEGGVGREAELVPGSVIVAPEGRLTVVLDGSVVWCGGSVFDCRDGDEDAAGVVCGRAEDDASVPMMVNAGLMLPESPNTGMMCVRFCALRM